MREGTTLADEQRVCWKLSSRLPRARWVAEEHWHKSQQTEVLPDGRVRMTFYVGITPEMVNWLLYYSSRVQVLEPQWLRERVAEEHRKAAGIRE